MPLLGLIEKFFKKKSERDYLKLRPELEEIKALAAETQALDDEALRDKTAQFRQRIADGETVDDLMIEAFAVAWEACRRLAERGASWPVHGREVVWDMVPYDVQIIGAMVLHKGKIAEMATGEGKTLVAVMPMYLNALSGNGAHLVTVNDYLAQRDAEWMGGIYRFLGLNCAFIRNDMSPEERREAYNADITYGTNNEFGFDYLRDNMTVRREDLVQRGFHYAIVDEVDSVLIDEARTPLIISGPVGESTQRFAELKPHVDDLVRRQTRLVNGYLSEAERSLADDDGIDDETALKLLRVSRGAPKNKKFIKLMKGQGLEQAIKKIESDYMRDKAMWEADAELFYVIDEKQHTVDLTEKGREQFGLRDPEFFVLPDLSVEIGEIERREDLDDMQKAQAIEKMHREYGERSEGVHNVGQLLKAYSLFQKDEGYVVQDGRIMIVDEFTGRMMPGRRFSDGLHSALEAKEGLKIQGETQTYATITLQNFFRMYDRLAGMTGTAETEAGEFAEIYGLDVTVVPTNRPITREDLEDEIYRTKLEKYKALIDEVERLNKKGLPILVGTTTVDVSETLSRLLKRRSIRHNVLNAKHHQREAEIVSEAGRKGGVTIATNMAGRGTDIKLDPELPISDGEIDGDPVGLHVLGSERHESRRIDRQLRGRSGRQGDPGSTRFYLSLEDDLMRLFRSDRIAGIMDKLGVEEGEVITHSLVTKSIERAQVKVEQRNFEIRKQLLKYDDVMNKQREVVYDWRRDVLLHEDIHEATLELVDEVAEEILENRIDASEPADYWDWSGLSVDLASTFLIPVPIPEDERNDVGIDQLRERVIEAARAAYHAKEQRITPELTRQLERHITLRTLDEHWKDHLHELDILRSGIGLRAYGQRDPLLEYKQESFSMFETMMQEIRRNAVTRFFRAEPVAETAAPVAFAGGVARKAAASAYEGAPPAAGSASPKPAASAIGVGPGAGRATAPAGGEPGPGTVVRQTPKVGRNDPCPCGSGKKYKKCHGQV